MIVKIPEGQLCQYESCKKLASYLIYHKGDIWLCGKCRKVVLKRLEKDLEPLPKKPDPMDDRPHIQTYRKENK